jgi:hypothetical protein
MEKDFIPYEEALALKELGFDERCFGRFNPDNDLVISHTETYNTDFRKTLFTQAPTFSQAFRWFRDNFGLYWPIMSKATPSNNLVYYIYHGRLREDWNGCFESYEEAELACLKKLIEIAKQGGNT